MKITYYIIGTGTLCPVEYDIAGPTDPPRPLYYARACVCLLFSVQCLQECQNSWAYPGFDSGFYGAPLVDLTEVVDQVLISVPSLRITSTIQI